MRRARPPKKETIRSAKGSREIGVLLASPENPRLKIRCRSLSNPGSMCQNQTPMTTLG